jgi:hypothetical protein
VLSPLVCVCISVSVSYMCALLFSKGDNKYRNYYNSKLTTIRLERLPITKGQRSRTILHQRKEASRAKEEKAEKLYAVFTVQKVRGIIESETLI